MEKYIIIGIAVVAVLFLLGLFTKALLGGIIGAVVGIALGVALHLTNKDPSVGGAIPLVTLYHVAPVTAVLGAVLGVLFL